VVLRDHGAINTLAGGWVVDPFPPRRGRAKPERLVALAAMQELDTGTALERLLEAAGHVALTPFALTRNLSLETAGELAAAGGFVRFGDRRAPYAASQPFLAELGAQMEAELAERHRAEPDTLGIPRGVLVRKLRGHAPEAVLDAALAAAVEAGRIVRDGAVLRLPTHQPRLTRDDEKLWQRVEPLLAVDDLRPPRVRELAEALGIEPEAAARHLKRFERFGRVAPVASNRYFLPETVARLADLARELAEADPDGIFTAASFKDRSGTGRNLTIEILEYLDRIGVTKRVGDGRIVMRAADATFG
jgi:selenocysteine-specific elongation factor